MFKYVHIPCEETREETVLDKNYNESIFELGHNLAAFVPLERITPHKSKFKFIQERQFANKLYEFYSMCEENKALYNEEEFYSLLSRMDNLFIPNRKIVSINDKRIIEYTLSQTSEWQNKIDYMVAVAYELMRRKITLNRCKECEKWFVAYSKSDTLYCAECAAARTKRRKANEMLAKKIKHICEVKKSYNNNYTSEYYQKYEDIKNAVVDNKPDTKTATLQELIEYGVWLKSILKSEFPRTKTGDIENGND